MSDGNVNCKKCFGRGVYELDISALQPFALPGTVIICDCVLERDLRGHLNLIYSGLADVKPLSVPSPLDGKDTKNLWITAKNEFINHLARVMRARGVSKTAKVTSDLEIMRAWLFNASEVYDGDIHASKNSEMDSYSRIEDLAQPPGLLIIKLGVKASRNSAMAECFLEALNVRNYANKPTWVLDSPDHPLGPGHLCWDGSVEAMLGGWDRLNLSQPQRVPTRPPLVNTEPLQRPLVVPSSIPSIPSVPSVGRPLALHPPIVEEEVELDLDDPLSKIEANLFSKKKKR